MENTFLKIDPMEGEVIEKAHIGWIAAKSIEWNVERTLDMTDLGTTQRGYANANFGKVSVTSELSVVSPVIMRYVATGFVTPEVTIEMCRAGSDDQAGMEAYLTFKLRHCIIDSYSVSGGEESIPEESWTLAYRGIELLYKRAHLETGELGKVAPPGVGKPQESFKWNLASGDVS